MPLNTPASGSRVQWWYCVEDSNGDISDTTPAFIPIRFNTSDLQRNTTQIDSDEINPARQREKSRQGTYDLAGSIVMNLTYGGAVDYLMAAALQSAWEDQAIITAATISAAAADNSYNDSGSGFLTAGFAVGQRVTVTGFTGDVANNITDGIITSVVAGKIIIGGTDGDVIADDAAGETVTIKTVGDYVDVGTTVPTVSLLRRSTDVSIDRLYRHCRIGGMDLSVVLNRSALATFPVIGETVEDYTVPGSATFGTPTTSQMMVPTIGYMRESGTSINHLTEYNLNLSNNMESQFALFSRGTYGVANGVFTCGGSMTAYLPDAGLADNFIDEVAVNHYIQLQDLAGNFFRFFLPDAIYTQLADPVGGPGAHLHTYTISAGYDGLTTIRIERTAAP